MGSFASRSTGVTAAVRHAISQLPCPPGVYRFRDRHGEVLYIGRATGLRARVASYWSDLRGREHLASMVPAIARVEAVACASAHEAAWLERNLLEARMPPWNRAVGGQEAQGFIWMSTGRVRPGLGVSYGCRESAATEYFGPYLGGSRQAGRSRPPPARATGIQCRPAARHRCFPGPGTRPHHDRSSRAS